MAKELGSQTLTINPDATLLRRYVWFTGTLVGFKRKRFVAVALDGAFRAPAVAPLLQRLVKARAEAKAGGVGLGVVSMLSFEGTVKALQVRTPLESVQCFEMVQ